MRLVIGRVGKPHGLRGDVTVEVRTDVPELRFVPGATLQTEPTRPTPLVVAGVHWHGGRLLLRFDGIEDRGDAEALRDTMLVVDVADDERPDDPEEYYDHQLAGLTAVTVGGEHIGVVAEVLHLPSQDLLAVTCPDGREVLVPFVVEIVPEVDLVGRRVVLDPPPGLIDAPPGDAPEGDAPENDAPENDTPENDTPENDAG